MAKRPIRRTATILAVIVAGALTLTGCGDTLEERITNRDACVAADGVYYEGENGFGFFRWECDLTTDTKEES